MAKFNIAVELDWINEDSNEGYNLDNEIKEQLVNSITQKVQDNLFKQVETECQKKLNEQYQNLEETISSKLNSLMEDFFNTPRSITDKYGDVVKKNVTVISTLKEACDNYMNQPLDEQGRVVSHTSYNMKYKTRVDYIVAKSIDHNMEYAIKKAVEDITNNLKTKISNEVKTQLGDKLAGILDLDSIIIGK